MRYLVALAGLMTLGSFVLPVPASADPPCGRGWRRNEPCGGYVYGAPVYVVPRPVYVEPRPVYVAPAPGLYVGPPAVVVAPPPAIYVAPSVTLGVTVPLR